MLEESEEAEISTSSFKMKIYLAIHNRYMGEYSRDAGGRSFEMNEYTGVEAGPGVETHLSGVTF